MSHEEEQPPPDGFVAWAHPVRKRLGEDAPDCSGCRPSDVWTQCAPLRGHTSPCCGREGKR